MPRVLMAAFLLVTLTASVSAQSLPICEGGPFQGQKAPADLRRLDVSPHCVAVPTKVEKVLGSGPMPKPGTVRTQSTGYHFAGSQTTDAIYTALLGYLEVQDVDLSASGVSHVIQTYLLTPDYSRYMQVGWIDESYGTNSPRLFVEIGGVSGYSGRFYFDQYPMSNGGQYLMAIATKPGVWYAMVYWNNTWNTLKSIPQEPREPYFQQFLEIYTSNGVHPYVPTLNNYFSQFAYQDTSFQTWDTSVGTAQTIVSPYCVNWVTPYHEWQPGSCE